jgi:hypothetical protein
VFYIRFIRSAIPWQLGEVIQLTAKQFLKSVYASSFFHVG